MTGNQRLIYVKGFREDHIRMMNDHWQKKGKEFTSDPAIDRWLNVGKSWRDYFSKRPSYICLGEYQKDCEVSNYPISRSIAIASGFVDDSEEAIKNLDTSLKLSSMVDFENSILEFYKGLLEKIGDKEEIELDG